MFIGEHLNEHQIAALQAVADACGGAQFARIESVAKAVEGRKPGDVKGLLDDYDRCVMSTLNVLLQSLAEEDLVEFRDIKSVRHVGLTQDGQRCNLISVFF